MADVADSTPAPTPEDEATYQAGLKAILAKKEPAPTDKVETKAADKAEPTEDEAVDETLEAADEEATEVVEEEAKEETPESKVDKAKLTAQQKAQRTFDLYKKAETEKLHAERVQLQASVEQHTARLNAAIDAHKKQVAAFEDDPFEYLESRGMTAEDAMQLSWQLRLAYDDKVTKDPKAKPQAEALRRQRQQARAFKEQQEAIEKLRQERETDKQEAAAADAFRKYDSRFAEVVRDYKAKSPLLATSMTNDAVETERELYAISLKETERANNGEFAKPEAVIAIWEKNERARLKRLGYSVTEPDTKNKEKTPNAAKKQGQSTANKTDSKAKEQAEVSEEEYHAELRRRLNLS